MIIKTRSAFSLLEILVSMAVLALLMVMILNITGETSRIWQHTKARMEAFEEARSAFDRITSILSQAELNIYWGYDNSDNPEKYERSSELQFLSAPMTMLGHSAASHPTHGIFFQAQTGKVGNKQTFGGLPSVLNAYGFFVEYGDDSNERPAFLPPDPEALRHRFRLKEWRVPSDQWRLYEHTSGRDASGIPRRTNYVGEPSHGWLDFTDPEPRNLAENIIALIISPRVSLIGGGGTKLTGDYYYNSRNADSASDQFHQLPPLVEIVLVAVDEESLQRSVGNPSTPPDLIPTGLFTMPGKLDEDLEELGQSLADRRIRYVVLRSLVRLLGAKGKT